MWGQVVSSDGEKLRGARQQFIDCINDESGGGILERRRDDRALDLDGWQYDVSVGCGAEVGVQGVELDSLVKRLVLRDLAMWKLRCRVLAR